MKKTYKKELVIGLTVAITLLILFFGIDYLKGVNIFRPANYYYATYTNVDGLAKSAPVTVNGFKVGLVREISYEYDNPGHIRVEMSLDKELKVPRGTKAVLTTDMLGTSTIALILGHDGGTFHEVGDELIAEKASGLMDNINGSVMPAVAEMIPHIDSLLVTVTRLAGDPAIASSIQRLDVIMANLERSTILLNNAMQPAPGIMNNASATMANAREISANLAVISADLTELSAKLKTMPIDSTVSNLNRISENLLAVSAQLNNPNSSLGLLMNDPALYNNINNVAAHLDSIMVDLKRRPRHYIPPIKIF